MNQDSSTPQSISQESIDMSSPMDQKLHWFQSVFRPHFDNWVFSPIDRLVYSPDALIGFIFMSCVIDYLAGFWYGESTVNKVKKVFTSFIDRYFKKNRYDANNLYDSLRNGLVHMFTIKNFKYALTHNHPEMHLKIAVDNQVVLNAGDFRDDLFTAKQNYFNDVERDPQLLDNLLERFLRDGFMYPSEIEIPK